MQVKEIDSSELKKRLDAGEDIVLLDIRSDAEVQQGVLPKAEHLAMHLIPLKLQDLPKDKDIILYCRSGARSYHACAFLEQQGVHNSYNLRGGIIDWARNGYEITTL
ncbi:MAG TPA: rhodanese-like domain-containing protein [Thiolapillus brandeum]|uniref:Rhodanese-like domain-containing protein n=1 Tax=Thiolapillus brandeum TaxID=1076588 RepID=A0A831NW46_9GAMM|nr:rhodanese-like domain-containing protein [Thiolapillus brandeum]